MSEPDISTLARRLAEQNNVDWRALHGSGPEGKVVERDVLDYLSRVMAGSEALDPTPEPLPEGMEAWPDQDLAAFRQGVGEGATSLDSLRDEIASSATSTSDEAVTDAGGVETVAFGRRDTDHGVEASRAGDPASTSEEPLGEDIFLFDDEAAPAVAVPEVNEAIDPVDELDDLLVAGDDDSDLAAAGFPEADDLAVSTFTTGSNAFGDGDDLVEDVVGDARVQAQDEFGDFSVPGFAGAAYDASEEDLPDLFAEAESVDEGSADEAGEDALFAAADDELDLSADDSSEPAGFTTAAYAAADQEPEAVEEFEFDAAWGADPAEGVAEAEPSGPEELPSSVSFGADNVEDDAVVATALGKEDTVIEADVAEDAAFAGDASEYGAVETRDLATPAAFAVGALPLARPANLLRRNVDLTSLASAQLAVSLELGNAEPLSVAPFLLRAVAKAAVETGLPDGTISLAELNGGVRLRRVDDAASRSFASLVSMLEQPFNEEDESTLAVADLGPLDLDEVILDLDVPVVSLGRVLYDTQRGGYRSTLALSGSLAPDSGARLLARVAELLDAPVRLVL